jgi:hypothetical protein
VVDRRPPIVGIIEGVNDLATYVPPKLSVFRKVLGTVVVLVLLAAVAVWTFGQVYSGHVFWRHHFGNPVLGAVVVFVLLLIGLFVLLPVRSEAAQHWRVVARMVLIAGLGLSLIVFGFVALLHVFTYTPEVVGHSPDGRWTAILVDRGNSERRELHLVRGSGLHAVDVSNVGSPCGLDIDVTFQDDMLLVDTNYGLWKVRFDPTTGHPFNTIGPVCAPS